MPLEDIQKSVGNISRLDAMYHGKQAGSPTGKQQMKPGDMGTIQEIYAMADRIEAENKRKEQAQR